MRQQTADTILMIRPKNFGYNHETAKSNYFQKESNSENLQEEALREFDEAVAMIKAEGIDVMVIEDTDEPIKTDSIFPNNWISMMHNGTIGLYPMQSEIRRRERRNDIVDILKEKYDVKDILDLSGHENADKFLEGTGSMVIDHEAGVIYACLSPRTSKELLVLTGESMGYEVMAFEAEDEQGREIYHTNVLMSICSGFAIACTDAIKTNKEEIVQKLNNAGKEVIETTFEQMNNFACNALQVRNKDGEKYLVISQRAWDSLTTEQKEKIQSYTKVLTPKVNIIEDAGGGGIRCMMAEVFLPVKNL